MSERRRWNGARTALAAAAVIGLLVFAPVAAAAPGPSAPAPVGAGDSASSDARLLVSAGPIPHGALTMSPGDERHWPVSARLRGAEWAMLSVRIDRSGALAEHPRGLEVGVRACPEPWVAAALGPECTGDELTLIDDAALGATDLTPAFALPSPGTDDAVHLLVSVALADSPGAPSDPSLQGLRSDIDVVVTASSIDGEPVPPSATVLAASGGDPTALLVLLAAATVLLVAGAATRRRADAPERRMDASCRPLRAPPR